METNDTTALTASSPPGTGARIYDLLVLLVIGVLAVVFLLTLTDYGYSWDEIFQNRTYGQAVLRFLTTFGEDQSALTTQNFFLYGGLFDAPAELLAIATPLDGFTARRLANAMMGLFLLVGAWRLGRLLGGPRGGLWTVLFLAATPTWYGHSFINAKDIPFAAGYIWSLYAILIVARSLPRIRWGTAIGLGFALALAVGIRVGGVLVIAYLVGVLGTWLIHARRTGADVGSPLRRIPAKLLLSFAIAYVLTAAFWPTVLLHPISGLRDAFRAASNFQWNGSVLYFGEYVPSRRLPWHYLPVYFGVKLPVPILAVYLAGLSYGIGCAVGAIRRLDWEKAVGPGLLVIAVLFPPVYAIKVGATIYDGVRHFLFIIPPLAVLAGMAAARLLPVLIRRSRPAYLLFLLAAGVFFVLHTRTMIQLHPYQYAFLSRLSGGMPAGAEEFESEYWATSTREAAQELEHYARRYAEHEGVPYAERTFVVAVTGFPFNVTPYLPGSFIVTDEDEAVNPDFFLSTTRFGLSGKYPEFRLIKTVQRFSMPFAVVKTSLPPLPDE